MAAAHLTGAVFLADEGSDWLHELCSTSTPYGDEPGPGEPDAPRPPAPRPPQGAFGREAPAAPVSGDLWVRGLVDNLRMGGPGWTTSTSEPGSWHEA